MASKCAQIQTPKSLMCYSRGFPGGAARAHSPIDCQA
jgi:hypothetical protein